MQPVAACLLHAYMLRDSDVVTGKIWHITLLFTQLRLVLTDNLPQVHGVSNIADFPAKLNEASKNIISLKPKEAKAQKGKPKIFVSSQIK